MKVGSGGNLGLSKEYPKKLFGPMFYSRCNYPLRKVNNVLCDVFSELSA